jgi:hypothetical protein
MADDDLQDFLILRELDDTITRDELDEAATQSGAALEELRGEDVGIQWIDSEVLTDDEGLVAGTFCHYQAEDESAVREHADRAGLPATKITRRGEPLAGE